MPSHSSCEFQIIIFVCFNKQKLILFVVTPMYVNNIKENRNLYETV